MPFPPGWIAAVGKGGRPSPGAAQHRIFIDSAVVGEATTAFADRAFLFSQLAGALTITPTPIFDAGDETFQVAYGDLTADGTPSGGGSTPAAFFGDTPPEPMQWCRSMIIINDDTTDNLLVSFDGVTIHDKIFPGEIRKYDERNEAGIAFSASSGTVPFRMIGW